MRAHAVARALVALAVSAAPAVARGDAASASLSVRVADVPSVSFDATALGRATHAFRLVIGNPSAHALALVPLAFRFRPVRDGVVFTCDEPQGSDDRWPGVLEAGSSFALTREVSCETPLPGRYDVEVRGRPRRGADADERSYATFSLQIDPGNNPPVRLPWDASLHAAASVTRDMRPSPDPRAARVVVAMINGTRAAATLAPLRAGIHVTRRGVRIPPCADHDVDVPFEGSLASGRMQSLALPLGCALSADGIYDVDVAVTNAAGARVKIASTSVRVGVLPPPPPRPEDERGRIIGGM